MRKLHYKGRCVKRQLLKCSGVCRTYDRIQGAYANILEANNDVESFKCNVVLERDKEVQQYTSDFVAMKTDGTKMVRECVWRKNLSRPTMARLLDLSRNYWLSQGVEDWAIVIEKEEKDGDQ